MDEYRAGFYTTGPKNNPVAGGLLDFVNGYLRGITSDRVLRGGSWFDIPSHLPVGLRLNYDPSDNQNFRGFRCTGLDTP